MKLKTDCKKYGFSQKDNVEKWQLQEAPEVVSFEHYPAGSSPDVTNDESTGSTTVSNSEDKDHAIAVAAAAVAAAKAAAKVVRLPGYGRHSKEECAATLIQSHYRGYLVIFILLINLNQFIDCFPFLLDSKLYE